MAEGAWETAHILFTEADRTTGAITCQLGDVKSGEVYDPQAVMFAGGAGDISLPAAPVAGQSAAEAVTLNTPGGNIIIGVRSVRSAYIAGLIQPGEKAVFADGSQACTLYKLDGSIIHFTTIDNTKDGRSVYSRVSPNGFEHAFPWGRHRLDNTGLHFQHVSGARLDFGSVTAPAPLNTLGSYFSFQAAMGRLNASVVTVGPNGSVYSPVARADATLVALQALQAEVVALATAVAALAAAPAVPAHAPTEQPQVGAALLALTSAVTASTAALAAAAVGTVPVPGPIGARALATA